jgi:hypothetical protein
VKIVTRSGWKARPPKGTSPVKANELVFHYSAANADEQADHRNCASRVRGIQRYHQETQGWQDLAYSFLACKHGYIFEGRGWGVRTAATGPANNHTLAVCFLGDDTHGRDDLTTAGRQALVDIAQVALQREGIRKWSGHRNHMSTSCPGNEIISFINSEGFKKRVLAQEPDTTPAWWVPWARWRLGGRKWRRPGSAPKKIPLWAWERLERFIREKKKP